MHFYEPSGSRELFQMQLARLIWLLCLPLFLCAEIPPGDQQVLDHFFKGLLTQGNFALTLFGQRPACLLTHQLSYTLTVAQPKMRAKFLLEYEGWKKWEKYQHLFTMPNFLFWKIPNEQEEGSFSVLFVHKQKMAQVLKQHADLFPRDASMEMILSDVFVQKHPEDPRYHLLQGVLLGYGLKNAKTFQEMCDVQTFLPTHPTSKEFVFRRVWQESNPFFCTRPCGYLALHQPQSAELGSVQQKMIDLYNSDPFLQTFLDRLAE